MVADGQDHATHPGVGGYSEEAAWPLGSEDTMVPIVGAAGARVAAAGGDVGVAATGVGTTGAGAASPAAAGGGASDRATAAWKAARLSPSRGSSAVTHLLGSVDVSASATSPLAMPHPQPAAHITTVIGTVCENFKSSCQFVDDRRRSRICTCPRPRRLNA